MQLLCHQMNFLSPVTTRNWIASVIPSYTSPNRR